ncbi:MAG: Bug family tripartite tricarboxylate transporter substrate binding protein [Lautropia sp.]
MTTRRETLKGLGAATLAMAGGGALAQQDRSTISVYVGAASSMDYTARAVADQLRASLGRTAIAVSKLGAGQRLALGEVKRAAPDGRSLVFATTGPLAIYPHIYTRLDYDPDKDFTPIIGVMKFDVAISTGPQTGVTDLKQLLDWIRARQDGAVFGSAPGNGSFSHFVGIATSIAAKIPLEHVPYKDSGVGLLDLAGGRIPMMVTGLSPQIPLHKAGKIRLLAVSGPTRSPLVPEVPTLSEMGINVARSTTAGVFGPAGMAPELVSQLYEAIKPLRTDPAVTGALKEAGNSMWPTNGDEMRASIKEERAYFGELVKASGYKPTAG